MKQYTKKKVEAFCEALWADDSPKITVKTVKRDVTIKVEQMYNHVDHSFKVLNALSQFFETTNIKSSEWSMNGCDTCDYGSSYTVELTIKP